jgi:F-type H+-transporting ATPase subunit gamma
MLKQQKEEISELGNLKSMVRVTGEIASGRMQKSRDGVLYRRDYLDELKNIFTQVHRSFLLTHHRDSEDEKKFTALAHNGKKVAVFLSANTRLYGDLLSRTFERFWEDVKQTGAEITVVGKVGQQMIKARDGNVPMTIFDLQDEKITPEEMKKILIHLVPYEEIHVFYGKYVNPVRQEAAEFTLSAELELLDDASANEPIVEYLYEPSLEKVLAFFENQIFSTMFDQTVMESTLAKYAARFAAMDRAEQQIDRRLREAQRNMRVAKHREANKKQINQMGPVVMRFGKR